MKDKNGIEIKCENCDDFIPVGTNGRGCSLYEEDCENVFGEKKCIFRTSREAYEARIAELQNSLDETEKKLTETIKLLGERSRECGELEVYNEVLQRRIEEFSIELLDRTMKENKDVLERLKQAESEEK